MVNLPFPLAESSEFHSFKGLFPLPGATGVACLQHACQALPDVRVPAPSTRCSCGLETTRCPCSSPPKIHARLADRRPLPLPFARRGCVPSDTRPACSLRRCLRHCLCRCLCRCLTPVSASLACHPASPSPHPFLAPAPRKGAGPLDITGLLCYNGGIMYKSARSVRLRRSG